MRNPHILVFITGGTIDALYDPEQGTPYHVPMPAATSGSGVPEAMRAMRIDNRCDYFRVAMKDSKDITDTEIDDMLATAELGGYDKVMVVSGTDHMPRMAKYIENKIAERAPDDPLTKKRFVFTGAMGPLRGADGEFRDPNTVKFKNDGWDNLRRAVVDLQRGTVKFGVYVRMGRKLWPASEVEKVVHVEGEGPDAIVTDSHFEGRTVGDIKRDRAK